MHCGRLENNGRLGARRIEWIHAFRCPDRRITGKGQPQAPTNDDVARKRDGNGDIGGDRLAIDDAAISRIEIAVGDLALVEGDFRLNLLDRGASKGDITRLRIAAHDHGRVLQDVGPPAPALRLFHGHDQGSVHVVLGCAAAGAGGAGSEAAGVCDLGCRV